tara:strand:- start:204 stop:416 length:213 start_codon:yes stop_codon:yes gene_type:complete
MALTIDEILLHVEHLEAIGERARALRTEITSARDDDRWTKAERRKVGRAVLHLSKELLPIAVAIGLDALD